MVRIEKPVKIYFFGVLYLSLGAFVIVGFFYLLATDFSALTFSGEFNAGDTTYTPEMQYIVVIYAIVPSLFIGGLFALPGAILFLTRESKQAYYLMLISSAIWSLPLIGLIAIAFLLQEDVKNIYLR